MTGFLLWLGRRLSLLYLSSAPLYAACSSPFASSTLSLKTSHCDVFTCLRQARSPSNPAAFSGQKKHPQGVFFFCTVINTCFSYSQYFCNTLKNMSELHLRKASSSFIQLTIPSASQGLYCLIRNFIYHITPVNANLCCLHHSPWGTSLLRLLLA